MKPWLTVTLIGLATAVLAAGGAAALWGRPGWLLTPMQRAVAPSGEQHGALKSLQDQTAKLTAENALLRARLAQYAAIAGEGGFPPERVVVARGRVVGRTSRAGRRFFELDTGTADGVQRDLPVADGWSLVGLTAGMRERRCLVQDLADSESRVPAAIIDGTGVVAEGVLAGAGEPGFARLDFIEPRDGLRIDAGMAVTSAGSDGRLPPGLAIGRIESAGRGSGAEHWRLRVRLSGDAGAAESLLLLRVPERRPAGAAKPAGRPAE
jgi:cell shape-determining protein MreC